MPKADRTRSTPERACVNPIALAEAGHLFRWPPAPRPDQRAPKLLDLTDWFLLLAKPSDNTSSLTAMCQTFRIDLLAYDTLILQGETESEPGEVDRIIDRREMMLATIIATRARTLDDLRAKATVLLEYNRMMVPIRGQGFEHQLAASIARDLILFA